MSKEQRFLDALTDLFVGAEIEGDSGYINLMRIKSRYYRQGVLPRLLEDIDTALEPFAQFREELFDKLYTFFSRYFSESGSIFFCHTPPHQSVYEQVYTDDRDVVLFWKTHMLYYVKTDRLFRSMTIEVDDQRFYFDVSSLQHKRANEKRSLVFDYDGQRDDGALLFTVTYSEYGRKTKVDGIRRDLKRDGLDLSEETLQRAFRLFERQSEVDYFINKDAGRFLTEQFDLWLYQYVFSQESHWSETRIRQLQVLKDIATKIIRFIAQFEDELVRIWNKPKFVLNSHYVITLDRIAHRDPGLIDRIIEHDGMQAQVSEWRELGIVGEDFALAGVWQHDLAGGHLDPRFEHLPLDTRFVPDLELDVLALFDHLDDSLDGRLIKSENFQALKTFSRKLEGRVRAIYIDPPFNTGEDFPYVDRFQDAAWLSILQDRLLLARALLTGDGSLFLHLDWNANYLGRALLQQCFGAANFVNEIVWRIGWVSGYKTQAHGFVRNHDTIFLFANDQTQHLFRKDDATIPYRSFKRDTVQGALGNVFRTWNVPTDGIRTCKVTIVMKNGEVYKLGLETKSGAYHMEDTWNSNEYEELNSNKIKRNAKEYTPNGSELTQKPEELLYRALALTTREGDLVLDFFLGSGTTVAAAHKLGRRWVGIEMGDYFESDALYRMKHVLAGVSVREPVGISATVGWPGGGFFKYFELEQYENVLRRARYEDADLFDDPTLDPYSQYTFLRDLKLLDAVQPDEQGETAQIDLEKLYDGIDLAETLSCVTGKWIRRVTRNYVEFEDGERVSLTNPPWHLIKPLVWW